jgi:hypothetical protein
MTAGLTKKPHPKGIQGIGNQMNASKCVLEGERIHDQHGQGTLAMLSCLLLLKVFFFKVLKIFEVRNV